MSSVFLRPSVSHVAALIGVLAAIGIALVEGPRAEQAGAEEIHLRIRDQIYTPIARARGQAQLLAGSTEVREGMAERNRLALKRALKPALEQMNLTYLGVLLPDGTPYFALPEDERPGPVLASRTPIEHELRTVALLEYGSMLTDEFLHRLASTLSIEVRLFSPDGRALSGSAAVPPSPGAGGFLVAEPALANRASGNRAAALSVNRGFGYVALRPPDNPAGPVVGVLGFWVSRTTAAGARIRRERDVLWAVTAGLVVLIAGRDVRARRRRTLVPRPFAPIPNPYIVGNPIRTPEMFFGRDDDFQFARQKLTSERAGVVMVFCGERRSGKTSMLFQILNGRLGPGFLPVLIDMQYFAATSGDREFYRNVLREIVRAVYPEAEQAERMRRFELPSESAAQSFELVLNDAMAAHPEKCCLFLLDEYEILEAKIDRGELSRNVIPYLAGLLERNRRLAFIFTGSKNLEERATLHWRVMLGKSLYRKISYLTLRDTERLIREPVREVVVYDPVALSRICRLTAGQPFYTQVICQNLIDHLNEVKQRVVGPGEVATIVDAIVNNPLPQMIYFWDSLPADEKVALSLLAETLADESSAATPGRLLADAVEKGVPLATDEATLQSALERVFEKELLMKSADRAFQYRIDLMRHWIRRTHSIWQVVKEARSAFNATA